MSNLNHIELFAGCGGLSLGLESVGFKLVMANELSPMAAETFAYNFFNEKLGEETQESQVVWLSTKFNKEKMPAILQKLFFPMYNGKDNFLGYGGRCCLASADMEGELWQRSIFL